MSSRSMPRTSRATQNINPAFFVNADQPAINIRVPAQNGRYNKGTSLIADYNCTDS